MPGTWGVAVPSPSAQRAAHPAASSLLVTHGRGGLALGDGEEGEPLQFNALQDSKMFVFLAKSLFDVDPIPFLESPEFYAKSGERGKRVKRAPAHLLPWNVAPSSAQVATSSGSPHDFLTLLLYSAPRTWSQRSAGFSS